MLTKQIVIDQIEVTENGIVQVRTATCKHRSMT